MKEVLESFEEDKKISKHSILNWIICSLKKGAWAPASVFSIHLLAGLLVDIYNVFPSFDIPMHFLGGVAITYFFIQCVSCAINNDILGKLSLIAVIILVFLLTSTTTIFWEFLEWTMDRLFQTNMQVSLDDTMLDMLLGILGASVMIIVKINGRKKQ